ncbi:MAG: hypothetical protein ACKVOB_10905 [Sphingomonas sp.]
MTPVEIAVEAAGWVGALAILVSYLLVSTGRLSGQSMLFQTMNMVGAIGFIINSAWHGALPSTVLNIIWLGIALATLFHLWTKRARRS